MGAWLVMATAPVQVWAMDLVRASVQALELGPGLERAVVLEREQLEGVAPRPGTLRTRARQRLPFRRVQPHHSMPLLN